jgi:alkylation response protein AidB-like acyl-CoA dehydrogenase
MIASRDFPAHLTQYLPALALEQALGDPSEPANALSARQSMALDEADAFPEAAVSLLHGLGLPRAYVPRALGGDFESCETFVALGRVLARRNMSVAVSYSTLLWSVLAWIGGDAGQQRAVADRVMRRGSFPCLAYSEADHGADLSANGLMARRQADGGYVLDGEKWPINRATRSDFLVLLARTDESHSLRNHTLFIIDKADLPSHRYYHLPRTKTHGLRGCDISGIGFRRCPVPARARVGVEGHGLELALKGFQVTRTFCPALSLGVGDNALRIVTDFATRRQLYGMTVNELPHARDVLANAYLAQLLGECVSIVAARGLHLYPNQFSTWSSVAKVHVSHLVDHAMAQLSHVLGARYYLREGHAEGLFQKFLRDGAVVSLFDGSSLVCLDSLATQLPTLVKGRATDRALDASALFDLRRPLPPVQFNRLDLFGRGRDAVLESLPGLLRALDEDGPDTADAAPYELLRRAAAQLHQRVAALDSAVLSHSARAGQRNSARQFAHAQRYAELHAATAALGLWWHNRHWLGGFFATGHWLLAILQRAGAAHFDCGTLDPEQVDALIAQLDRQHREHQMFSLLPWPLAETGSNECRQPIFENCDETEFV